MKRFKFVFNFESVSGLQILALVEEVLKNISPSAVFFLHGIKTDIKTLENKVLKES
ncbi:hypothetical protein PSCICG_11030 [Pseudomonas cichorii]|nr:hypothetical protein PSCICG_11030 [Pseudomonas cichorii]